MYRGTGAGPQGRKWGDRLGGHPAGRCVSILVQRAALDLERLSLGGTGQESRSCAVFTGEFGSS